MVVGFDLIKQEATKASSPSCIARRIQNKLVVVPIPFKTIVIKRNTLVGRVCVGVEKSLNILNSRWTKEWWAAIFRSAINRSILTNDQNMGLYRTLQKERVLDPLEVNIGSGYTNGLDSLMGEAPPPIDKRYEDSILRGCAPLEKAPPMSISLFREILGLSGHANGLSIFAFVNYTLTFLGEQVTDLFKRSIQAAEEHERAVKNIIAKGSQNPTGIEDDLSALASCLHAEILSAAEEKVFFKGGYGSGNQFLRDWIYKAGQQIVKTTTDTEMQSVKAIIDSIYTECCSSKDWELSIERAYQNKLETKFHIPFKKLKNASKLQAAKASKDALYACFCDLILEYNEEQYLQYLKSGQFEVFFQQRADDIIDACRKAAPDYVSSEWQEGVRTFLEEGTLDKIPEYFKDWLPEYVQGEFSKQIHSQLFASLKDLFPGNDGLLFLERMQGDLNENHSLEKAFRSAFGQMVKEKMIGPGSDAAGRIMQDALSQMPPEVRGALGEIGVGIPASPLWYVFEKTADSKIILKVLAWPDKKGACKQTVYTFNEADLTQDMLRQLIEFRIRPRVADDVSYTLDDVHTYLSHVLGRGISSEDQSIQRNKAFHNFNSEQLLVFKLIYDELGIHVPNNHLYDMRKQALKDLYCRVGPKNTATDGPYQKPREYAFVLEGAEALLQEASGKIDQDTILATYQHVNFCEPLQDHDPSNSTSQILLNYEAKQKIAALLQSVGTTPEHIAIVRRSVKAALGRDMARTYDAFIEELIGRKGRMLNEVNSENKLIAQEFIGGLHTVNSAHSMLSSYVQSQSEKAESIAWKFAMQMTRAALWAVKICLTTVVPFVVDITPQVIRGITYRCFMACLNVIMPLLAQYIAYRFFTPEDLDRYKEKAFQLQREMTRTGTFNYELRNVSADQDIKVTDDCHHLQLLNWFRPEKDIKIIPKQLDLDPIWKLRNHKFSEPKTSHKDLTSDLLVKHFIHYYRLALARDRSFNKALNKIKTRDSVVNFFRLVITHDKMPTVSALETLFKGERSHFDAHFAKCIDVDKIEFPSLNHLTFNVKDGKAYYRDNEFYIAQDQRLIHGMRPFSKYLVLENSNGRKKVLLAEDMLDASVSSNLVKTMTRHQASPWMGRLSQTLAEEFFDRSLRPDGSYFEYDYNCEEGRLESSEADAMAYLTFHYITQGEVRSAEQALDRLRTFKELTPTVEPLLKRMLFFCSMQPDRRILVLTLKVSALCERLSTRSGSSDTAKKLEAKSFLPWNQLELIGVVTAMQRYLRMKHRMIDHPLSEGEELLIFKGIERRTNALVDKECLPWVKKQTEKLSGSHIIDVAAPSWVSEATQALWGYVPERVQSALPNPGKQLLDAFNSRKALVGRFMPPELRERYSQLLGEIKGPSQLDAHREDLKWVPQWAVKAYQKHLPFEGDNPANLSIACALKQQIGLERVWGLRHRRLKVQKLPNATLTVANLRDYFLDYYRLALAKDAEFSQQLSKINSHDPVVAFFKMAQSVSNMPAVEDIQRAFSSNDQNLFDKLFTEALVEAIAINYDGPVTTDSIQAFFYSHYCKARSYERNYHTCVGYRGPLAKFFIDILKSPNPREFPEPSRLKAAMEQAIRGDQSALVECLKDFKKVLVRQQRAAEIRRLTSVTELPLPDYLRAKMGIGPRSVDLNDPCSVCLNIIAQFPKDFPQELDLSQVTQICANKLRNQKSIDIVRDIPAKGPIGSHQVSSYPTLMALPNLIGIAKDVLWNKEYKTGAARTLHSFLPAYLERSEYPPVPLNRILRIVEKISSMDTPKTSSGPEYRDLADAETTELDFDDEQIKVQLEKLDCEMALDLRNLIVPHLEAGKFKSTADCLEVRYLLEQQEKRIDQEIDMRLRHIVDFVNKESQPPGNLTKERIQLVKSKEIMKLFAEGKLATLHARTGLSIEDSHKLMGMLLAYHQLRAKRMLNKQWQNKLAKNPNQTIKTEDFKLQRPIDWNQVTVDELRRYFIFEACQGSEYILLEKDLKKAQEAFRGDPYRQLLHKYPEYAAQGFRRGSFS